ncbi:MAG: DUF1549 domain-containing protein, partial [Planctomycetaceae bacterium]|nr:DUF1549 domain-containing protein [Planctomycetaceae bacterium]
MAYSRENQQRWQSKLVLFVAAWGLVLVGGEFCSADERPGEVLTAKDTAAAIDQLVVNAWKEAGATPADLASDAEYLRRVSLDVAGRIPSVAEIREFLADQTPDKRQRVVEELLDRPAYVRNMTTILRNSLIPQANSNAQFRGLIPGFEAWLWERISAGTAYDQIAREIITTPIGAANPGGPVLTTASSPEAFFLVRELKPENLTTGTARAFLGVRIDCAQCHDHPFDNWKQKQFWSLAAFYSGFAAPEAAEDAVLVMRERTDVREITIPATGEVVPAVFLDGETPQWTDAATEESRSRRLLAEWVTAPENPYFARMAVNRLWGQFFGRGLVHPIDDFSESNPPSHPEVLDLLASQFALHHYDLRFLVRAITATRVYQSSSVITKVGPQDEELFTRAALRGLTPEQFFDSLAEAVGYYQPYRTDNPFVLDTDSPRSRFLELFRNESESPLHHETTILQALA